MTTKTFSQYLQKLESTPSRNEMTVILAELFEKSTIEEIDKICYLLLGELSPSYKSLQINLAEKMMIRVLSYAFNKSGHEVTVLFKKVGDLGDIGFRLAASQKEKALPVSELYSKLVTIAKQTGTGSQERKIKLFAELISKVDNLTVKYLIRIPIGKLRLGFSNVTILDALSWMRKGDKSLRNEIETAFNVNADIGLIAQIFKRRGLSSLKKVLPKIGIPIRPALTERLPSLEKIIEKMERPAVEPKYDGFRVQIHFDSLSTKESDRSLFGHSLPGIVNIFSRQLESTTEMFPEVVEAARKIPVKSLIFDGEAIGVDPNTGRFLPFQETAQRKRKYDIAFTAKNVPLKVFVFDLLSLDGKSLLNDPLKKRRQKLESVFKKISKTKNQVINLTPQKIITSEKELEKIFNSFVTDGLEGIVCKKTNSPYKAGKRDFSWVKYKKAMKSQLIDTIDCLVMGYYRGKGKRSSFGIGAFLAGIYDSKKEAFLTIAKIGTGLSDEQWREIRGKVDKIKTHRQPKDYLVPKTLVPDIWANPKVVVEISADEITKSPIHSSLYALRFPRMKRFRNKQPTDITTVSEIVNIIKKRSKR